MRRQRHVGHLLSDARDRRLQMRGDGDARVHQDHPPSIRIGTDYGPVLRSESPGRGEWVPHDERATHGSGRDISRTRWVHPFGKQGVLVEFGNEWNGSARRRDELPLRECGLRVRAGFQRNVEDIQVQHRTLRIDHTVLAAAFAAAVTAAALAPASLAALAVAAAT
eukprot:scaffold77076_cov45-Phaeocystis_antarctica.AAC.1